MSKGRVLIVDDESSARSALSEILSDEGYKVRTAADGFRALAAANEFAPDVVLTDLKMPGMDGLELLQRLAKDFSETAVILMTAFGAVESAVSAMRAGATDYLVKPLNSDELLVKIERALVGTALRKETKRLKDQVAGKYKFENIIGESAEMQAVFKTIRQVAKSRATVLISGDSGTGKEMVAAALHHSSPRKNGPFIKLHCAALAETLLESELFGHERGSFTGADRRRIGRFEEAHGGTLFLDEIGEISPAIQVKLLRVLQEHELERVGGNQSIAIDVRVVAATNRDLAKMVLEGKFREDLYYRLNVINLKLPSLLARKEDIPALASHFLLKYARENDSKVERFDDDALSALKRYHFRGNVRELENIIERAVVLCEGPSLGLAHLPQEVQESHGKGSSVPRIPGASLAEIEKYAVLETLANVGGSTTLAAQTLGISVRKIQYRLQEYAEAPKNKAPAVKV